ncbi:MAG TPA: hypothetical protein VGC05_17295, partial [Mycobacterium sp.]
MPKQHPGTELHQTILDRRHRRLTIDPQPRGSPPHQPGITKRISRRNQQQPPSLLGQHVQPPQKTFGDSARQPHRSRQA